LSENHDLVWDDGVAPELCIDFDAPFISKYEGLAMWLGGIAFFGLVGFAVKHIDQPERRRMAVRTH
jgi:hypothetical protein